MLINVTLINIKQVKVVRSAYLFKFVLVEIIVLFRGEASELTGVQDQRSWEWGPRGGNHWRGPMGRALDWGRVVYDNLCDIF